MKADRYLERVRARVAAHPLASVGAAFAIGMLVGGLRSRRASTADAAASPRVGSAALAGIAAFAMHAAKDFAFREATEAAWRWWDRRRHEASSSETRTSPTPGSESFVEH